MPRRFSGDVRITVNPALYKGRRRDDAYSWSVKAQGAGAATGETDLDAGYTSLHGEDEAIDLVACEALIALERQDSPIVKKAAAELGTFYIGRDKAHRWPGATSNELTKRGR